MLELALPGNKRFAFTVIDDTDAATLANIKPVYELLERLGLLATKTVWPVGCPEGSKNFSGDATLEDNDYCAFVLDLQRRGFEITWHGGTMESSTRERSIAALERFREIFGHYPRIHANHALNRENLYWGVDRIDQPIIRFLYRRIIGLPANYFEGHVFASRYWWGDQSAKHIKYVRNLTFSDINTLRVNPSMPYRDERRPCGALWFSATDAEDAEEFAWLLRPEQQERLEAERGVCLVATHFGKGFVSDRGVHPVVRERLEALAQRPGWFPTVSDLLDWLLARRDATDLPRCEWQRMQWQWARDLIRQRLTRHWRRFNTQ